MSSPGSLIALAKMTRWTIQARQGKYNTFAKLIDVPTSLALCGTFADHPVGSKSDRPLVVSDPFVDRFFALDRIDDRLFTGRRLLVSPEDSTPIGS
jgi:hypothetical protein